MSRELDIKHKHAGHFIVIQGKPFRANDGGQWDLTEIWQTLKLSKGKQPGKFMDRKEAQRLEQTGKIGSLNLGRSGSRTLAAKQAVIRYAAWVSPEFEDMVFNAFEAILEMPEIASLVADKMRSLGNHHTAVMLERSIFKDKCEWKKSPHRNTVKGLKAAIRKGNLTPGGAHMIARKDGLRVTLAALEMEAC